MRIKRKEASKMQENIVKEYPAIFDICPKHWLQFENDGIIEILKIKVLEANVELLRTFNLIDKIMN